MPLSIRKKLWIELFGIGAISVSRVRIRLDSYPKRVQYAIAVAVMVPIATLGWIVGKDNPVPAWITELLIPVLSVIALIFMGILVVDWVRRRTRR